MSQKLVSGGMDDEAFKYKHSSHRAFRDKKHSIDGTGDTGPQGYDSLHRSLRSHPYHRASHHRIFLEDLGLST